MLVDEYGVSAQDSEWYVASMHHWDDHDPGATVVPRDGSSIRMIENRGKNTSSALAGALFDGQVDALGVTESQLPTLLANTSVRRLFDNPREVEASYFRSTQNPADHACAGIAEAVDRAGIRNCRRSCFIFTLTPSAGRSAGAGRSRASSKPGPISISAEEQEIFNSDPWAYGLEANRHVLEKFFAYCHAQGISARGSSPSKRFSIRARSR